MLSKAEVLYLQGQKKVSSSYERKLKCMIRKKVEGLKKEVRLLSKLIPIEQLFDFDSVVAPSQTSPFNESISIVCSSRKPATEFSNSSNRNSSGATKSSSKGPKIITLLIIPRNYHLKLSKISLLMEVIFIPPDPIRVK